MKTEDRIEASVTSEIFKLKKIIDKLEYKTDQTRVRRKICKKQNEVWKRNWQRINTYLQ